METSTHYLAVALPLMLSGVMTLATIVIHAIALIAIVNFIRHHHRLGRMGLHYWGDVTIVSAATLLAGAAHLLEVFLWSLMFILCGEFSQLSTAFYTSGMLYTSLGTGMLAMSSPWRLLGPFETADGMLAFGVSTAIVISVIQLMIRTRFHDLPNF